MKKLFLGIILLAIGLTIGCSKPPLIEPAYSNFSLGMSKSEVHYLGVPSSAIFDGYKINIDSIKFEYDYSDCLTKMRVHFDSGLTDSMLLGYAVQYYQTKFKSGVLIDSTSFYTMEFENKIVQVETSTSCKVLTVYKK